MRGRAFSRGPLFGAITTLLFSNRGRLESNLPNPDLPEDFGDTLLQRVVGSTALLVAVAVGLLALGAFTFHSSVLDAVFLVGLAAVVADLIEEWSGFELTALADLSLSG